MTRSNIIFALKWTAIVFFFLIIVSFSPLTANADDIANRLRLTLHYPAARGYVPTEKEMQGGCPVATTSFTYKTYIFFKHLF